MGVWGKRAGGLAAAAVVVAGCTAVSHVSSLQPPPVPASPPMHIPSLPPKASKFQRGIDVDFYAYPNENVGQAAAATVRYAQTLHANAISISFPFFMASRYGQGVEVRPATPTPSQLATVIIAAQQAGMRVTLRPLLDERSLGGKARAHWIPVDKNAWFASYLRFLTPYLIMANHMNVAEFITGTELSYFATSHHWDRLNAAIRRVYHGQIGCADNWFIQRGGCGTGAVQLVDAYKPLQPPLKTAWRAYTAAFPRSTVLSEVSIAAIKGAWAKPFLNYWPGSALYPPMQAQWFTDACHAAIANHLAGMYFWSIDMAKQQGVQGGIHQSRWAHSAGADAIARCYAQIQKSGR
jgi:hypothetical protein